MLWVGARGPHATVRAQDNPTPVQLQFPTPTETPGPPTETPTRTATSAGRPFVEAIQDATNVRAGPDINEDRLGQIYPGTRYAVLGKRFEWYWIEYPESPIGSAWVHNSVVTLTGDPALIPDIELDQIPTIDPQFINQQGTAQAVQDTPGALASLTAQALITPTGLFTPEGGQAGPTLIPGQPLPTFTYPPYTVTPVLVPRTNPPTAEQTGVAPIMIILALAALGLMGLLVGFLRRI